MSKFYKPSTTVHTSEGVPRRPRNLIADQDKMSPTSAENGAIANGSLHRVERLANIPAEEVNLPYQDSMARAVDYYSRLEKLLDRLENRVSSIDGKDRNITNDESSPPTKAKENPNSQLILNHVQAVPQYDPTDSKSERLLAEVRECDWEHFINRYGPDDRSHIIELLVGGCQLGKDAANETERRKGVTSSEKPTALIVHRIETHSRWIQRVRIRSKPLLEIFRRVTGYAWGTKPLIFVRPFQYLIHFHSRFKEELERLESQSQFPRKTPKNVNLEPAAMNQESHSQSNAGQIIDVSSKQASSNHDSSNVITNTPVRDALNDLRCYIQFAEDQLLPQYKLFHHESTSNGSKIRFDDLWYLFRAGDLIYIPQSTLAKATKPDREVFIDNAVVNILHQAWMHHKVWRLCYSLAPGAEVSPSADSKDDRASFRADCYYLDFDGTKYGPVKRRFCIEFFEGEKNIRDLDFYPLRFAHDASEILESHIEQGQRFVRWAPQGHAVYNGWTFVTNPEGVPIADPDKSYGARLVQQRTQYVEGEVVIDFREAINSCPRYQPDFVDEEQFTYQQSLSKVMDSPHAIIEWSDASRSKKRSELWESVVIDDDCDVLEAQMLLEKDPYLRDGSRTSNPPEGDDLALLPARVFVYALRLRKFVPVDCHRLDVASVQQDAFRQLQLPEEYKQIIQATIHSHLWKNDIERIIEEKGERSLQTQDFIMGKGRGLLILLHGEPGVGKTATAESVAQSTGRPLFTIACSSLGNEWELEEKLADIFRLAHLWKCVLLMDEADVFLSARNTSSGTGASSIVSIFLRRIEYYNGILFLTTNRIGKLDPALGSRIHLILHYKRLGASETTNIFRTNMERLQQTEEQEHEVSGKPKLFIMEQDILRFAADHYNKYPKGKGAWNGRQIRNAFMVAASLARYEADQPGLVGTGFQPQLRYSHFREVERLSEEYNRFRAHVLGGDDSRKAFLNEERDDDYEEYEKQEKVSDIVGQLKLARLLYLEKQDRTRSGGDSPSNAFPGYYQPQLPAQQSMMEHHTQPYSNQVPHQFAATQESENHNVQPSQSQGRYNIMGTPQDNMSRAFAGEQHRTVTGGITPSSNQVSSQRFSDTQE